MTVKEGSERCSPAGFEDEGGDMAKKYRKLLEIKKVKERFSPVASKVSGLILAQEDLCQMLDLPNSKMTDLFCWKPLEFGTAATEN